jgi:hypothetical protein
MITRRNLLSHLTLLCLLGLAACTTPPPSQPSLPPKGPLPQGPETTEVVPASPGIALLVNGNPVTLEQLQAGGFPPDQTVTVAAKTSTPYSEVAAMLVKLHEMGYLVAFSSAD